MNTAMEKEYGSMADTTELVSNDELANNDEIDVEEPQKIRNVFDGDPSKQIDFILVYEKEHKKPKKKRLLSEKEVIEKQQKMDLQMKHEKWRHKFLKSIQRKGISIEVDEQVSTDKTVYYYKLHAPWDLLCYYAEELNLRAPLQLREYKSRRWSEELLKRFPIRNVMENDVPNMAPLYFTCTFRQSKVSNFLGSDNQSTYFKETERHRITWEVLQQTVYGKKRRAEIGIERLLNEEVFDAAFPLHDGPYQLPAERDLVDTSKLCKRQVLYEYWARWGYWYKYQPVDHIRDYFGEKIGLYFAWLGFYTSWLLPVAIIGLLVFLVSLCNMSSNVPAMEICNKSNHFIMCPACDTCKNYSLYSTCLQAKMSYLFDNPGTIFFAILMSFWAVLFLEYWKRKNANIAHHWEVMDYQEQEERPRPEYAARAPLMEKNPITGVIEPHFSPRQRLRRMFTGFAILIMMLFVVIIFVISIIVYKGLVGIIFNHSSNSVLHAEASVMKTMTGACLNLILIMLMANVYTAVAEFLTRWEMHRTQTEYENAFTFKVFIFQFVNYYSSIFYIAFFKGKLVGYPGHYATTLGLRNEKCGSGGCLIELAQQLFVIMVGKQAINNVQELVVPKFKQWLNKYRMKKAFGGSTQEDKPWEDDYRNLIDHPGLFEEYLEMVLQFGFITIFVAAFPIAPLFALLNNWIEIRLDAGKFVCETRRPVAERAQNIGVWFEILDAIVQIAVISNGFLIAFTSEFIPRLMYKFSMGEGTLHGYTNHTLAYAPYDAGLGDCRYKGYRDRHGNYTMVFWKLLAAKLAFVIAFEHVVFFVGRMLDWLVPDVPQSLEVKMKRERFLAKQALADNQDNALGNKKEVDEDEHSVVA